MNKILSALVCAIGFALPAVGQTTGMTQIAATGLSIGSNPIATGTVCATAVDANENPVNVAVSGGGMYGIGSACAQIVSGAITTATGGGTYSLPDEVLSEPTGFTYTFTITDTAVGSKTYKQSFQLHKVPGITGSSFQLDRFFPNSSLSTAAVFSFTSGFGAPTTACSGKAFYQDNTTQDAPVLYSCGSDLLFHDVTGQGAGGGTIDTTARASAAAAQSTATAAQATATAALPKSGGTLTGPLALVADPTVALGAATKQYVDNHAGSGGGASIPATSSLLKGTGTANGVVAAVPGTDYVAPGGSINGTASNLSGTPALPNGTTGTTQTTGDTSTKLATDAFVLANGSSYSLPQATTVVLGGVKCDGVTTLCGNGIISSVSGAGTLPTATAAGQSPVSTGAGNTYTPQQVMSLVTTTVQKANGAIQAPAFIGNINSIFYVAAYAASGTHTQYDMARQAADAFANANTNIGSVLILLPGLNKTCDAVPLPNPVNSWATTSMIGAGSGTSIIQKQPSCGVSAATMAHPASISGLLSRGWYQGFEVDAAHIDTAACNTYGYSLTTYIDVTCANAVGPDHEWEFGSTAANNTGWMDNIYGYNLRVLDNVGGGKGAIIGLTWTGNVLTGGTIVSGGQKNYTQQYIKATLIGPGLASCTTVPTLTIQVSNVSTVTFPNLPTTSYGVPNGVTITNGGNCTDTADLHVLVQDEYTTGVTSGFKFTNMADSVMYDVEALGTYTNGELITDITSNNSWVGEHPFTNDTYEIVDQGSANKHINTEFDSPGYYAAVLDGQEGSFVNPSISWDGNAYLGSSGYWARHATTDINQITGWTIVNSMCTEGSDANTNPYFNIVTTANGLPISPTNLMPTGLTLNNVQICDGSLNFINNLANGVKSTDDLTNYSWLNGSGLWLTNAPTLANGTSVSPSMGIHSDYTNNMMWLRNVTGGGGADIDALGIDPLGQISLSEPIHGAVIAKQLASPAAPTITPLVTGTTNYTYACTATDANRVETPIGASTSTAIGPAVLSSTVYNSVMCPFVEGFASETVYRQANDLNLSSGAIGQLTKANFEHGIGVRDTGQTASVTPSPTVNLTSGFVISPTVSPATNYIAVTGTPVGKNTLIAPSVSGYLMASTTPAATAGDVLVGGSLAGTYVDSGVALSSLGGSGGGTMIYPGVGLPVSTGSAWGTSIATTSLATLTGTQTLTNKTVDGVTPATMAFVDATSSIQTQLTALQTGQSNSLQGSGSNPTQAIGPATTLNGDLTTTPSTGQMVLSTNSGSTAGIPVGYACWIQHAFVSGVNYVATASCTSTLVNSMVTLYTSSTAAPLGSEVYTLKTTTSSTGNISSTGSVTGSNIRAGENGLTNANTALSATVALNTITLSANYTFTMAIGAPGQTACLQFIQNSTTAFTVTPPSNIIGFFSSNAGAIGTTLGKHNTQCYVYSPVDTSWVGISGGVINQ